jgi:hypothetical protein
MDKPVLSKQAFWDVDMNKIDYEKNATHVIAKVFDRGTFDDIIAVMNFYGDEKIKDSLLNIRYVSNGAIALACVLFDLKQEDFRCYRLKQSDPHAWPF